MESFVTHDGYLALVALSVASGLCLPVPTEIVFTLAGALCTTGVTGRVQMGFGPVLVWATVGSLIGSVGAYEVARLVGRPLVERYGRWLLLSPRDLERSEAFFARWGALTVLVGRLVPVVHGLISLPAGVAEMDRRRFWLLTAVGSLAWAALLAGLGYAAGSSWGAVSHGVHAAQYPIAGLIVLMLGLGLWHRWRSVRRAGRAPGPR
ncbi:MAG TPA: DedA family protein [Acidimicrobiales bacterium]|nr:MAG: hypothetical protein B7Z69_05550 [Actinobacteria bacterium 21-73-9]HQU26039.1 DedA family protein [Acidimicrobiales bacterium]